MKKKQLIEFDQQIYIFEAPEEDSSQNSIPSQLIKRQFKLTYQSKFQQSAKENIKGNTGFDPHLLKQNMFSKRTQQFEIDYIKKQPLFVEHDNRNTPAEINQIDQIYEDIFIADDLDFTNDKPVQVMNNIESPEKHFEEASKQPKEYMIQVPTNNNLTNFQPKQQKVLLQHPIQSLINIPAALAKNIKQNHQSSIKNSPKISGLTIYRHLNNVTIQITNKISLLLNPIPLGIKLNCKLKRSRDLMNILTPQYDFFLENGLMHVMSVQKKFLSNSQAFLMSTDLGNYEKNKIIACLRTNILHNDFLILGKEQGKDVKFKYIYGSVNYGKLSKDKTQRHMSLTIPINASVGVKNDYIRAFTFDTINKQKCLTIHRRMSNNEKSQKNFSLIDSDDDYDYLRLTKQSDNVFNIEIQHPLSPMQAFGVILTRFDAQLK